MQPANRTGLRLGFHQCQMPGQLESLPVQKSLQSRVRDRVGLAEQAVHDDELTTVHLTLLTACSSIRRSPYSGVAAPDSGSLPAAA